MADNVLYTEGSGKTIATDDVGGVHYQKVKLDVGADGTALQPIGSLPVYVVSGTGAYAMNDPFVDAIAIAGQLDDTSTTNATEDDVAPVRITTARALHVFLASGISVDSLANQFVLPYSPNIWHYTQEFTAQQTDYNIHSGVSNVSHYVNTIYFAANAAGNAWIKDGTTVTSNIKWKYYAGGQGDGVAILFNPPLKFTVNTNVGFSTSTGVTCFLSISGFTAP